MSRARRLTTVPTSKRDLPEPLDDDAIKMVGELVCGGETEAVYIVEEGLRSLANEIQAARMVLDRIDREGEEFLSTSDVAGIFYRLGCRASALADFSERVRRSKLRDPK